MYLRNRKNFGDTAKGSRASVIFTLFYAESLIDCR